MAQIVSFDDYKPPRRFDNVTWTDARIEEAAAIDGPWTVIDTVALSPPDADPAEPMLRSFTTTAGTGPDLWYRATFLDGIGNESNPTTPVLNSEVALPVRFATTEELARVLKIRTPSAAQITAMERVLTTAAVEIKHEIDLADDTVLTYEQTLLAEEVNLERAVEHWRQEESPFGLVGLGAELGSAFTTKDTWERHALKLVPLKSQWGIA